MIMSKSFPRFIEHDLFSKVSQQKVHLLFGARQTGKSTLLKQHLPGESVVIDLQDSEQRMEFSRRPRNFSEKLLAHRKKSLTVVVDEIQKVPALFEEVQWLYDQNPKKFRFYLTGSSARKIRSSSANLLPGRSHLFHLYPLTQPEYGNTSETLPILKPMQPHFPKRTLEELLLYGSLPGIQKEKPIIAIKTLQSYTELYLEEEIRREGFVRDIGAFSRFLELAALESGKTINLSKLSNESGVPLATLRLYYQILVDTFTGYWLEPFGGTGRKRILTTPKFLFFDLGVRNAAARLGLSNDLIKIDGGAMLESWVGLELIHRTQMLGRNYRVGFWRTVDGAEVDLVLQTPTEIIPIEVKWTTQPTPHDARHLELFMKLFPKAKRGYVVCRCREPRQLSEKIQAIPWESL
jgi:predicted AAA+ superfamily ATPase